MNCLSRRCLLAASGGLLGAGALSLAATAAGGEAVAPRRKLKIVVAGAHPDDPESGCGGTIARLSDAGHEVVALYLTRGERGIQGKSLEQAAGIRTAEAEKACKILGARPVFAGQIDGDTEVNQRRYADFRGLLEAQRPDVVFTHWPVDTHRDHRACSHLVYDAWLGLGKRFALYYFEVLTGEQTQNFAPTDYVDIGATEARKREATMAHASQNPEEFYPLHDRMNRFRGDESGCKFAEAFIRQVQGAGSDLLDHGFPTPSWGG
jgi:LmbE family N-acetylglucosaminyl deacetylase